MRTREQERSKASWQVLVSRYREHSGWKDNPECGRYLSATKKIASRIYVSGLGMAIAFLQSRKKDINEDVADDLGHLVLKAMGHQGGDDASLQLTRTIQTAPDVATVAWATEEALAACTWVMRYLEGAAVEAKEEDDQGGGDGA